MLDRVMINEYEKLYNEELREFLKFNRLKGVPINSTLIHNFQMTGSKYFPILEKMKKDEIEPTMVRTSVSLLLKKGSY